VNYKFLFTLTLLFIKANTQQIKIDNSYATKYWDKLYTTYPHTNQNDIITDDFLNLITKENVLLQKAFGKLKGLPSPKIINDFVDLMAKNMDQFGVCFQALKRSSTNNFCKIVSKEIITRNNFINHLRTIKSALEIGCGRGEMTIRLSRFFNIPILGSDISPIGIALAIRANAIEKTKAYFRVFDCNKELAPLGAFDLAIISNTLEHFKEPFKIIDNTLKTCKGCLIIVPYNQPLNDGYDAEGGAGHVYTFTEKSFKKYKVLAHMKFKSNGWQHSSCGEPALQLAILLKKESE